MTKKEDLEKAACNATSALTKHFNPKAQIPYGVTVKHVEKAMNDFVEFLSFINTQLGTRSLPRFENFLMPANFSSMVGEFVAAALPKHCPTIARNKFHNGHPDMVPKGKFKDDTIQYGHDGIEIKASRYVKGWQGHNAEESWLMVFCFDANRQKDDAAGDPAKPFRFLLVCGAQLAVDDWLFSGRSQSSRRTITAPVTKTGYNKMMDNGTVRNPVCRAG
jgi:hypothetical protein